MWTPEFWKDAAERALKTAAQVALAIVTATAGLGVTDIDWATTASVVGLATLASVLTSIISAGVGPTGTPSVVTEPATA